MSIYHKFKTIFLLALIFSMNACSPPSSQPSRIENELAPIGDSVFPTLGDRRIDVKRYAIDATWSPDPYLEAAVTLSIVARRALSVFSLDFDSLSAETVKIDGNSVSFEQRDSKLIIRPATPIRAGDHFDVTVEYSGALKTFPFVFRGQRAQRGWLPSPNGGGVLISEPTYAQSWLPSNNHPTDKALFEYRITVPVPYVAAANGLLTNRVENDDTITYEYLARDPMAPYLATIAIEAFEILQREGPHNLPIVDFVGPGAGHRTLGMLERQAEFVAFFSEWFGPYPFETYGAIVIDGGTAMEQQTRPVYDLDRLSAAPHETVHMWIGNYVGLSDWQYNWFKEGIATYAAKVLWQENGDQPEAAEKWLKKTYAELSASTAAAGKTTAEPRRVVLQQAGKESQTDLPPTPTLLPPGKISAETLFSKSAYEWSALMWHAFRLRIGDDAFRDFLQTIALDYGHGTVGMEELVSLSSAVAGEDMAPFFDKWLTSEIPPDIPEMGLYADQFR